MVKEKWNIYTDPFEEVNVYTECKHQTWYKDNVLFVHYPFVFVFNVTCFYIWLSVKFSFVNIFNYFSNFHYILNLCSQKRFKIYFMK